MALAPVSLLTGRVDALRAAFINMKQQYPFKMDAVVILPVH